MNHYLGERSATCGRSSRFAAFSGSELSITTTGWSVDLFSILPASGRPLTGIHRRIKGAVLVAWMTFLPTTLTISHRVHADIFDAIGLHGNMDHPDVASLAAPDCTTFIQNCARDALFTQAGLDAATEKIRPVYADLKHPERFHGRFYHVPHRFDVDMQENAFAWLEPWLKHAQP